MQRPHGLRGISATRAAAVPEWRRRSTRGGAMPLRLDEDVIQDPYSFYRMLRQEAPVREVELPRGLKVWAVTRYADAREALASPDLYKDMRHVQELVAQNNPAG